MFLGGVFHMLGFEISPHKIGPLLPAPQVSEHVSLELVFMSGALLTNGVCLHVLIEKLVWVQFWALGR